LDQSMTIDILTKVKWRGCSDLTAGPQKPASPFNSGIHIVDNRAYNYLHNGCHMPTCCTAVEHAKQVNNRMDVIDEESKNLKYTIMDREHYSSFAGMMKLTSGAEEDTSDHSWEVHSRHLGDMGPPEHVKVNMIKVFKALESVINTNHEPFI
jgi:hypothetical protein